MIEISWSLVFWVFILGMLLGSLGLAMFAKSITERSHHYPTDW